MTNKEAKKRLRQLFSCVLENIPNNDDKYSVRPEILIEDQEQITIDRLTYKSPNVNIRGGNYIYEAIKTLSYIQLNRFLLYNK